MFSIPPQVHFPAIGNRILILVVLVFAAYSLKASPAHDRVLPNANQSPGGQVVEGQLTIHLEAATGEWYPEENDGPPLRVAAFREEGGSLFTPGPLIRVVEGTEIHATISNRLDQPLTIHGLHSRPGSGKDVLIVCSRRTPRGKFSRRSPWNIFLLG